MLENWRRSTGGAGAAVVLTFVAAPVAGAQPPGPPSPPAPCNAAVLAHTVSSVANAAGGYLDTHPGANQAITTAGSQPTDQAEATLRDYFLRNPGEYNDLRNIAQPLTNLRNQCNQTISGGQISALLQALER